MYARDHICTRFSFIISNKGNTDLNRELEIANQKIKKSNLIDS